MTVTEEAPADVGRFPCRSADDTWALIALLVERGEPLAHMRLLRWGRPGAGEPASESGKSATIAAAVQSRAPTARCVRYDDSSVLVIADDAGVIAADLARDDAGGGIEVWVPVSVSDDGFGCRRDEGTGDPVQPVAAPAAKAEVLPDAEFIYLPVWDVEANAVFCYLCHASWRTRDGTVMDEAARPELFRDTEMLLTLDVETLGRATDTVQRTLDGYGFISVLIPVHFSTLADPKALDTYRRQRDAAVLPIIESVAFEIVGLRDSWTADDLDLALTALEPCADGVFLRISLDAADWERIPADSVYSVGTDVARDGREDAEILADLTRFAEAAKARGLRSHVHGLRGVNLSLGAARAGFDYLGSDTIAEALRDESPDTAAMATEDLLKSILARRGRPPS